MYMTVEEERLEQLRDEVAHYGYDWPEFVATISDADTPGNAKLLLEYLEQAVPHLKKMRRELGYTTYEQKSRCYLIHNYTFATYSWFKERAFKLAVVTPAYIAINVEELTPTEVAQLRKRLLS